MRQRWFVVVLLCAALPMSAAPDPTYTALRAARPDGRSIAVTSFSFDRDAYRITLNGSLHFLQPVAGITPGAVFVGKGEYTLTPATATERRQLAIQAGDDKLTALSDTFESAVFFDATLLQAAQASAGAPKSGTADGDAVKAFDDFLKRERKDLTTNLHLRVLQEILDPLPQPLFLAYVNGRKLPPAILAVDPRGGDALRLFDIGDDGEKTLLMVSDRDKGGIWYLAHLRSEYQSGTSAAIPRPANAEHYLVETSIASNAEISGTTTMTLTCEAAARILPIALHRSLRIDDASYSPAGGEAKWTPVAFVQEKFDEDADAALIFPEPLVVGSKVLVKVTYHGTQKEVLRDAGDGNFMVGARDSWYPNVGSFRDTADFELTFRTPAKSKNQIVAVGAEVENKVEGEQRISVWKSGHPLRVAGFNYGRFKKRSEVDKESGMAVDVYTNPGEPDIIRQINAALEESGEVEGRIGVRVNAESLAQAAYADGANTARVGNLFFGPLADKRIAITQQSAWFYGQSWPTLVYLPYLAFVGSTARNIMGFGMETAQFVDQVGAHEVAHQWWGHQVGWKSYHDAWLSEGFAEFTSGLVLQLRKGNGAYNDFYEQKRKHILERPKAAHMTTDQVGPISQGNRLASWQNDSAYSTIVYDKGAYVLQMLRMTMRDTSKQDPEEAFVSMMKDFASTYAGKNASTLDFQHMVEKHATKTLKLKQNGSLDWFFDQWVRGTAIPRYTSTLQVQESGGGKYKITGAITQSEVTDSFAVVLPLYLEFEKGSFWKLGDIAMIGNSTKPVDVEVPLPKKPRGVTINAMHDVLAR